MDLNIEEKAVRVCCFGEFRVEATHMQDFRLNWRTKKAKELFAFLFHLRGHPVERYYILEKIWPDKPLDVAVGAMHCAIYSIRQAFLEIGMQDMILHQDRKYSINMHYIHSELEFFLLLAKEMEKRNLPFIEKHKDFFLGYQGRYMHNLGGEWHVDFADYFDKIFLIGCRMFAKKEIKNRNYEAAVSYLKQGIQIDEFSEVLYAMMIYAYGKKREFKNMRESKLRIERLLRDELGIEKSRIICSAYESIQNENYG